MKLPQWPAKSVGALAALFRPLQDLDIYVEDERSEAFYSELVRRAAPANIRIKRVFPMNGRSNVLTAASQHDFTKHNALFLIDGDFEWVRGESPPTIPGVYRLEMYCVENLLICEHAVTQLLMECEACSEADAKMALGFVDWCTGASPLIELFIVWAVLNKVKPERATTSIGVQKFLAGKPSVRLDDVKVSKEVADAVAFLSKHLDGLPLYKTTKRRVKALPQPLDVVSGKDFMLPMLDLHLRGKTKEKCSRKSLKFRLARCISLNRLSGLQGAILKAAKGKNKHW